MRRLLRGAGLVLVAFGVFALLGAPVPPIVGIPAGVQQALLSGVELDDNEADAFNVGEGANDYVIITSTDNGEKVTSYKPLYTTNGVTAGTAARVGGILCNNTTASTAQTGAVETAESFDTTCEIPANTLKVGTVFRVYAQGIHVLATLAETHGFLFRLDAVDVAITSTNIDPTTFDRFSMDVTCAVRSIGASGTIICGGAATDGMTGGTGGSVVTRALTSGNNGTSTATVDTTVALTVAMAIDRGVTTDSSNSRLDMMLVEVL
jgi:hypothetical protein